MTTRPRKSDIKWLPEKYSNTILCYKWKRLVSNWELQQRVCRTQDLEWTQDPGPSAWVQDTSSPLTVCVNLGKLLNSLGLFLPLQMRIIHLTGLF